MIEFAANFPDVIQLGTAILIEKSVMRAAVAYSLLLLYLCIRRPLIQASKGSRHCRGF